MKNKIIISSLLIIFLTIAVFSGCSASKPSKRTFHDTNKSISMAANSDWKETTELNLLASLQIANVSKGKYLMVIPSPKDDFTSEPNIDEYTNLVQINLQSLAEHTLVGETVDLQINNLPGKSFELAGKTDNTDIVYYVTTLQGKNDFYQIISWTTDKKNKDEIMKIIKSFKEL